MGFCSPSLLGDQEDRGLQLCLGILGDPGSTKKQAGIKVGLHLPSISWCFFCLSGPLWPPIRSALYIWLLESIMATYTVRPPTLSSHLLTPSPGSFSSRGYWPDLLFSMGPHYRELLCLYSPVGLESLAGLEIPRGRSEEVTPLPGHLGGKRKGWSSLQALSSSTQDGQ